jgi:hypothetical protein
MDRYQNGEAHTDPNEGRMDGDGSRPEKLTPDPNWADVNSDVSGLFP